MNKFVLFTFYCHSTHVRMCILVPLLFLRMCNGFISLCTFFQMHVHFVKTMLSATRR